MSHPKIPEDDFIISLKAIVEEHLNNDNFSIEQLCREIGLSRTQLHRKVKAATQLSTSLFIRKIRLQKAKELLENSNYNISEIAYQTGNKSPQNFSKYFIKEFGVSPSNYRKQFELKKRQSQADKEPESSDNPSIAKVPEAGASRQKLPLRTEKAHTILIGSMVVVLLLVIGTLIWKQSEAPEDPGNTGMFNNSTSIAILPFQNYGPPTEDFFCEGVVEDILTYLAQFEELRVISRTSTVRYKDTEMSIQEIGAELGVSYLLEGSVRQDSNQVLITAQLIRVRDDKHIWAQRYDRPKKNILQIQTEVAKAIAGELNQSVSEKVEEKLARVPTGNIEAYSALLRGRHLMRSRTKKDLYSSLQQFEAALHLDSNYAEAYLGLATTHYLLASLHYIPLEEEADYREIAERNALKTIRLNKNSSGAYGILGNLYVDQYRWEEAISAYEIALDLNPNDALINYWFSLTLRSVGDLERSLQYNQIASELDPLHPVVHAGYVYTAALAGEFELGHQILEKVKPFMEGSFLYYIVWGNLLLRKGEYEAAIPISEKGLELNPSFRSAETDKFYCLGKLGELAAAEAYIASLDTNTSIGCLRAAKVSMSIGQEDEAMQYLKKAATLGLIPDDLVANPIYVPLHSRSEFIDLLNDYNFYPFYNRREISR